MQFLALINRYCKPVINLPGQQRLQSLLVALSKGIDDHFVGHARAAEKFARREVIIGLDQVLNTFRNG